MNRRSAVFLVSKASAFVPEVQAQAKALSLLIAQSVRDYFRDEENRKKFEEWYEQRYGKKYQWEPVKWRNTV